MSFRKALAPLHPGSNQDLERLHAIYIRDDGLPEDLYRIIRLYLVAAEAAIAAGVFAQAAPVEEVGVEGNENGENDAEVMQEAVNDVREEVDVVQEEVQEEIANEENEDPIDLEEANKENIEAHVVIFDDY
uniref:Uncharacterized protein n=1 Tax=Caenorhabditis tropicalis TaxID=1561998 RepID=A0A1I7TL94_9PELO